MAEKKAIQDRGQEFTPSIPWTAEFPPGSRTLCTVVYISLAWDTHSAARGQGWAFYLGLAAGCSPLRRIRIGVGQNSRPAFLHTQSIAHSLLALAFVNLLREE